VAQHGEELLALPRRTGGARPQLGELDLGCPQLPDEALELRPE